MYVLIQRRAEFCSELRIGQHIVGLKLYSSLTISLGSLLNLCGALCADFVPSIDVARSYRNITRNIILGVVCWFYMLETQMRISTQSQFYITPYAVIFIS